MGVIVFVYLIDGVNSVLNLYPGLDHLSIYEPMNQLRLFSGLGMGIFISVIIYPLAGQAVWNKYSLDPVLNENRHLLFISGGAILLGLMILLDNPLFSYPLILASTAGLVLLLTILYTVIWLLITKRENSIGNWKELVIWGIGGSITALVQIMAVDLIRFSLTGTWSGFLDY